MQLFSAAFVTIALLASPVAAELRPVKDRDQFVQLVTGKKLTRPLVELEVTGDGGIRGMGVRWEVTGKWSWQDGFFCRDLNWGGDDLGYNCQEVRYDGRRLRFISDKGAGESADFRLR